MINLQELIKLLASIENGAHVICTGCYGLFDETCPVGEYLFEVQGWKLTFFFDSGDIDYLDEAWSPRGEHFPFDVVDGKIDDRSDKLEAALKAAIVAYATRSTP